MSPNIYSDQGKFEDSTVRLIEAAHVPTRFREANLHKRFSSKSGMAMDKCREYAKEFPNLDHSMILAGSTGSGKTHMACATGNEILRIWAPQMPMDIKFFGVVTTLPMLLDSRYFRREEQYTKTMLACLHADLLIVDDLLHVPDVEWAKEVLYRIYESRYQNRLPTITTLNVPKLEDATDPFETVSTTFNEPFMRRLVENASHDGHNFTLRL